MTTHASSSARTGGGGPAVPAPNPAENYERYFVPAIGAPLAEELVDVAAPAPGDRVVDVACGTGVVTRLAARRVGTAGTVTGVDVNPGMLAVARSVTDPGLGIAWREARAEAMALRDACFDVVLCQMGLQFFADRSAALREMWRVLAPGGRCVANVPGPAPPMFAMLEEALRDHVSLEAARFVAMVFSLHEPGELERLVADAGFDDVAVLRRTRSLRLPRPADFLWQYASSTPLAGAVAGLDEQGRAALEADVVSRWRDFTEDGGLIMDVDVLVVTARRA